ncbi:Asp-tRNA(Asn)/Glu-tRNA(Gln) amidotransferase subunit GatB [Patescibacteria group bacterium]
MSKTFVPVIGLEIHLELETVTKMFCRCPADHFGKKPNTQTCPVCLGLPGALPYPNQKAIEDTVLLGLALGCRIPLRAKFDRKNYFYPDLPKGYQISQYDQPFAHQGSLTVKGRGTKIKKIGITRVHLEEDTGKLIHTIIQGKKVSLIDFNRSGVALVEIVSEPEIETIETLLAYGKKVRQVAKALKISSASMEKGQMRFELNISLREKGEEKLPPYRVEVKNLNSFRFLKKAAELEIERQRRLLSQGITPDQETRGYDEEKEVTFGQRSKEEAHDYRYFPEPDIPPIVWTKKQVEQIRNQLPELPDQQLIRYQRDYHLSKDQAEILTKNKAKGEYFERAVSWAQKKNISLKTIANLIINEKINWRKISPKKLVASRVKGKSKSQVSGSDLKALVNQATKQHPEEWERLRSGKMGVVQFFIGQVMRLSRGQAKPTEVESLVLERLKRN